MTILQRIFRRAARPAPLRLENGDAFSACLERYGITAREGEIIRMLIEGKDSKAITEALFISEHTVKNHIHHIYQKLEIRNRIQLVQCFRSAIGEPGAAALPLPEGLAELPGGRSLSRFRVAGLAALTVLIGLFAALVFLKPWTRKPSGPRPKPVLAVLDFENLSADGELEKWMTGLPLLLAADLNQSKFIRVLSDDAVYGVLKKLGMTERRRFSRDELGRLAAELKADYLLTGSLMKAGGRMIVSAVLQDARTGAVVRTDKVECADEQDLMRKTDGLARLVKSGFNLTNAQAEDDIDSDLMILASSSPLAFKYYVEGRRCHRTGEFERALIMFEKAVELDPEFAAAYWAMAMDAGNIGHDEDRARLLKKAVGLAERLPDNCREKFIIRGDYYALSESTLPLAAEAYKRVLEDYPDDPVANNNLALLCYALEDYEAALKYADVPIGQGTEYPYPYYSKARALLTLNRAEDAVKVLRSYHESHPANRIIYDILISVLIVKGDFAGAEAELEKAASFFPDASWTYLKGTILFHTRGAAAAREEFGRLFLEKEGPPHFLAYVELGAVALAEGRFREAEAQFRAGTALAEKLTEPGWEAIMRGLLGGVLGDTGKPAEALRETQRALEGARALGSEDGLRWAMLFQGIQCLRFRDTATVARLEQDFRNMAAGGTTGRPARDYLLFQGLRELEWGRPGQAVSIFEKALAELPPGDTADGRKMLCVFFLASAREKAGDFAGAAGDFEKIVTGPGDRIPWTDLYPRAVLALARSEEKLAWRNEAIGHYRMFLELWKNADTDRPEIEEARVRLKALTG